MTAGESKLVSDSPGNSVVCAATNNPIGKAALFANVFGPTCDVDVACLIDRTCGDAGSAVRTFLKGVNDGPRCAPVDAALDNPTVDLDAFGKIRHVTADKYV